MASTAQQRGYARLLGIDEKIIYGYVREHDGFLPPVGAGGLAALESWGNATGRRRGTGWTWFGPCSTVNPGGSNIQDCGPEALFLWPDPNYGPNGEAFVNQPAGPGSGTPADTAAKPGNIAIPGATGLTKSITDFWNASMTNKLIVGGGGLLVLKVATARR